MSDGYSEKERRYYDEPPRKSAKERFAEYQAEMTAVREGRLPPRAESHAGRTPNGRHDEEEIIPKKEESAAKRDTYPFGKLKLAPKTLARKDALITAALGCAVAAAAAAVILILAGGKRIEMGFAGGSTAYYIGEETLELSQEPYICDDAVYVPAEDILKGLGYEVVWNTEAGAFEAADKKTVSYVYPESDIVTYDGRDYRFSYPTMIHNDIVFIPLTMLTQFTDNSIKTDGEFKRIKRPARDTMDDTAINDDYRLAAEPVKYNDVYLVGEDTAMELLAYTETNCAEYAAAVNAAAAVLPEVNVYNIALPSAAEFYGPGALYTDQISGIRSIYKKLDPSVMPINAAGELWAHADEKLYFNTDHHWTQRGAYYAYKAFIENKGWEADPIESFETQNVDSFLGSWIKELQGTVGADILGAHPELLERFMPKVEYSGAVYDDMRMQKLAADNWDAIRLDDNTYTTFLGGDMPLIHYKTSLANGRSIAVVKESFGNAFVPWLLNSYEDIYVIDPRNFNGFGGHNEEFKLRAFYDETASFDDLIIISYPNSTTSSLRQNILNLL